MTDMTVHVEWEWSVYKNGNCLVYGIPDALLLDICETLDMSVFAGYEFKCEVYHG